MLQFLKNIGALVYTYLLLAIIGGGIKMLFALFATLSTFWIVFLTIFCGSIIASLVIGVMPMVMYPAKLWVGDSKYGSVLCSISVGLAIVLYISNAIPYTKEMIALNPGIDSKVIVLQVIASLLFLIGAIMCIVLFWSDDK